MKNIAFITGNQAKADYLSRNLGIKLDHRRLDLPEIQSLDTGEVALAKAKAAHAIIGGAVLVEDIGLHFQVLGRLPGAFIKWFEIELGNEKLCRLLDPFDDRSAVAEVIYCLYDGSEPRLFTGVATGCISDHPRGKAGFGFDPIFLHDGLHKTRAELPQAEQDRLSPRRPALAKLRAFLQA